MNDVWVFPLEPLDNRYTKQWYNEIPDRIQDRLGNQHNCYQVLGKQRNTTPTPGAFLDFADTNFWKSTQLAEFCNAIDEPRGVADDATILFTDFWNPALLQVAYMRDLLGKNWKIHGIAHAGAYDPSDILGIKMQKPWPWELEKALFYASDVTYFASEFHRNMFLRNLAIPTDQWYRAVISGQPHGAIIEHMESVPKTPMVVRGWDMVWPHRYNEDKQPKIAEDLAGSIKTLITQKHDLDKNAYYQALGNSKIIFSCSLHENLGISMMEGVLAGAMPLVPDRCSYSEMYFDEFKYPSEWTDSFANYTKYKSELLKRINQMIQFPQYFESALAEQTILLKNNYLSADTMISRVTGSSV